MGDDVDNDSRRVFTNSVPCGPAQDFDALHVDQISEALPWRAITTPSTTKETEDSMPAEIARCDTRTRTLC